MRKLSEYPIKTKLTWMNVIVCGIALLLACVAFVLYSVSTFRTATLRNLSAEAQIIGANSVSAVVFNDPQAAEVTLSALQANQNITLAVIYGTDGAVFAKYSRDGLGEPLLPQLPQPGAETHEFSGNHLSIVRPILFNEKPRAYLYLQSDLDEMNALLRRYALIAAVVMLASLIASHLIASKVQKLISQPVVALAQTAQLISREKQYSVRAEGASSKDEVGILVRAFNEMLDTIQLANTALHKTQERLNLSLKSAGIGTWSWDLQTNNIVWDDYIHPLFGLAPGAFDGTYEHFETLVHSDDRTLIAQQISMSIQRGTPLDSQYRVVWPTDGSVHILGLRAKVYRDDAGKPLQMTGVCWDITDLKRAEQEVRKLNEELEHRVAQRTLELEHTNRELEAFTYSVAHDLRAPLRHIHGFSKLLEEQCGRQLDDEGKEYLHDILDGTQNMGRLIDDLLMLGRVGRQELRRQTTGLNSLVEDVLRDSRSDLKHRDIEWDIEQLPFVDCDPGLIKQVFANLISNAAKYTRPRNPARIHIGREEKNGERTIFVRDNGVGFNSKYAAKLFGVFQRLHRKEDFEGTGVGLATVQRILHKHGGRIWAESQLDQGATFYFTLPDLDGAAAVQGAVSSEVRTS